MGLSDELQDIRLLLDERSKADHVMMSLVVYATVEMHESDEVLRQFGFRQTIPSAPQDIEDLHHINLRRRTD
ncbi:hypothetical protein J1N35_022416 [Gossypium stocksii]|uniref:Uncharacterized protein n=1 Tax=Gossypium stocksii TaxID=47602 RepID=A0A9D3VG28_9ROSI|nr:hypothetical protein J1N35_022416 [Gossypium stocksii]